jgi:LDH2 family malate/lactate/ureidoglycolate dehydrogenase
VARVEIGEPTLVPVDELVQFTQNVFTAAGLDREDAAIASEALVAANLRGVDTHGARFLPIYIRCLQKGLINPRPQVRVNRLGPSLVSANGDNGEGHAVAGRLIRKAIGIAKETGACTLVVRDVNHLGMLAYYVELAAEHGLVAHAMTNGEPWMAPWGGRTRILSTNPIAWAVPAGARSPVVLDMATSVVAMSKIVQASRLGESIPLGWGLDRHGKPTNDPSEVIDHGTVAPVGDYKGYGLSLFVDLLSGVLGGGPFSTDLVDLEQDRPQGIGCFFSLVDPARFMPLDQFCARVDEDIRRMKASELARGSARILYPGELEAETRERRRVAGVPLPPNDLAALNGISEAVGLLPLRG